jgi:hypothetical protein
MENAGRRLGKLVSVRVMENAAPRMAGGEHIILEALFAFILSFLVVLHLPIVGRVASPYLGHAIRLLVTALRKFERPHRQYSPVPAALALVLLARPVPVLPVLPAHPAHPAPVLLHLQSRQVLA